MRLALGTHSHRVANRNHPWVLANRRMLPSHGNDSPVLIVQTLFYNAEIPNPVNANMIWYWDYANNTLVYCIAEKWAIQFIFGKEKDTTKIQISFLPVPHNPPRIQLRWFTVALHPSRWRTPVPRRKQGRHDIGVIAHTANGFIRFFVASFRWFRTPIFLLAFANEFAPTASMMESENGGD